MTPSHRMSICLFCITLLAQLKITLPIGIKRLFGCLNVQSTSCNVECGGLNIEYAICNVRFARLNNESGRLNDGFAILKVQSSGLKLEGGKLIVVVGWLALSTLLRILLGCTNVEKFLNGK